MAEQFVNIKGLSELQKQLDELPAKIEGRILRGAMRQGAKVFEEEVQRRVPVDTGNLKGSIRVSVRLSKGRVIASIKIGGRSKQKEIIQLPNGRLMMRYLHPYYAQFVEYGTARHYIAPVTEKVLVLRPNAKASSGFANRWTSWVVSGVDHPGAKAKPFMRPAFDGKHRAALDAAAEYIKQRLPRELRKIR